MRGMGPAIEGGCAVDGSGGDKGEDSWIQLKAVVLLMVVMVVVIKVGNGGCN